MAGAIRLKPCGDQTADLLAGASLRGYSFHL